MNPARPQLGCFSNWGMNILCVYCLCVGIGLALLDLTWLVWLSLLNELAWLGFAVLSNLFCWILLGLALLGLLDLVFIITLLAVFGLLGFLCFASLACSFLLDFPVFFLTSWRFLFVLSWLLLSLLLYFRSFLFFLELPGLVLKYPGLVPTNLVSCQNMPKTI